MEEVELGFIQDIVSLKHFPLFCEFFFFLYVLLFPCPYLEKYKIYLL